MSKVAAQGQPRVLAPGPVGRWARCAAGAVQQLQAYPLGFQLRAGMWSRAVLGQGKQVRGASDEFWPALVRGELPQRAGGEVRCQAADP